MTSGGQIMSPNYPDGYALNGDTFTYTIQNLDPYGHIRLVFDDWMIADSSKIQVHYILTVIIFGAVTRIHGCFVILGIKITSRI